VTYPVIRVEKRQLRPYEYWPWEARLYRSRLCWALLSSGAKSQRSVTWRRRCDESKVAQRWGRELGIEVQHGS